MLRAFRYVDQRSDKLWICKPLSSGRYQVWWGRTGTTLTTREVNGESWRKVDSKLSKGYVPVDGTLDEVTRLFTFATSSTATSPKPVAATKTTLKPTRPKRKSQPALTAASVAKLKDQAGFF